MPNPGTTTLAAAAAGPRRSRPFVRPLTLPGWSPSSWGYDARLECFWAELRPEQAGGAGVLRIGPDHLITTVPGLARALARTAGVQQAAAYRALTAPDAAPDAPPRPRYRA